MTPMPIVTPIIIPSGGGGPISPADGLILGVIVLLALSGVGLSLIGIVTDRDRLTKTGFGIAIGAIYLSIAFSAITMIVQFFLS